MANALTTAEFFGTPVTIHDHAGRHWLTAEEAARRQKKYGRNESRSGMCINTI